MTLASRAHDFYSYGTGTSVKSQLSVPDSRRLFDGFTAKTSLSPRGAGLSLTEASFCAVSQSIEMTHFCRVLSFDQERGQIQVESGISLGRLASCSLPKGWYLSVQPGHPNITVGGCIASNAHGKHQYRDGCFRSVVLEMQLFNPDRGLETVRAGDELFELSIGGYGLTGLIVSATLQLSPLPGRSFKVQNLPCPKLSELPQRMSSVADDVDLLYSWHDLCEQDEDKRRAFIRTGSFARDEALLAQPELKWNRYQFDLPSAPHYPLLKRLPCCYTQKSTAVLNRLFYHLESKEAQKKQSLSKVLFPVKDRMMYYHLFGNAGVIEMQWLFELQSWEEAASAIQACARQHPCPVTLASAKLFKGSQKGFRFEGSGLCFSLNVPNTSHGRHFAKEIDAIGIAMKAKPNIIKDTRLSAEVVRASYPEAESTIKALRANDPEGHFKTQLSQRLEF